MWNGTERRTARDGVLKLIWDNNTGKSILPLTIFLIKVRLVLCLRSAKEPNCRCVNTGV